MTHIVLPGDFVTENLYVPSTNAPKLIGHGLVKREDGIYAVTVGVLHESENKLWLNTSTKRYFPHSGDRVLGTVFSKAGDFFRVDIGATDLAMLNFTSFEGATKRNRPNIKVGDLIYGQVIMTSKNIEPEISCVDSEARARGMGVITTPGLIFSVSLNYARRLVSTQNKTILELGKKLKFETIVGVNGKIWITGEHTVALAARDFIVEAESTFDSNLPLLLKKTLQTVGLSNSSSKSVVPESGEPCKQENLQSS